MKQAIAIGAKRMMIPISRIETVKIPSIACCRRFAAGVLTSNRPIPNTSAKNMTARMSFSAAAEMTLVGMMVRKVSTPGGVSDDRWRIAPAPPADCASSRCARARSTPAPGWKKLVTASAIATATEDKASVSTSVRTPTCFSALTSPISATPTTSAEKSRGITSMKRSRRKICPTGMVT